MRMNETSVLCWELLFLSASLSAQVAANPAGSLRVAGVRAIGRDFRKRSWSTPAAWTCCVIDAGQVGQARRGGDVQTVSAAIYDFGMPHLFQGSLTASEAKVLARPPRPVQPLAHTGRHSRAQVAGSEHRPR